MLLVSLLALALPWAAYRYVQEMEAALRGGLANALVDSAAAVAGALSERPDLLYGNEMHFGRAPEADLYAHPLDVPITLDGYNDDWALPANSLRSLPGSSGDYSLRYAAGADAQFVYLFLRAYDDWVVYPVLRPDTIADVDAEIDAGADSGANGDRVYLALELPAGGMRTLLFSTTAPGAVLARELIVGDALTAQTELRVQGQWQPTPDGFTLELRVPRDLLGRRLGFTWVDVDGGTGPPAALGTIIGATATDPVAGEPGALVHQSPALAARLASLRRDGKLLRVVDMHGWVVGRSGTLTPTQAATAGGLRERLYRLVLDPRLPSYPDRGALPGQIGAPLIAATLDGSTTTLWHRQSVDGAAIVSAVAPIHFADRVVGAVVLEQNSDSILLLANAALTRLLGVTLTAFALAALGLLGFATWLSLRVRRLSHAAETAVHPDGRIVAQLPGTGARDEIGALARSFTGLLERLQAYTDYLRTLASKLSHELRTPLAVVRSSLENLDAQGLDPEARVYAQRAREGSQRLQSILQAMSEATRVEESVKGVQPEAFDLAGLLRQADASYRDLHPTRRFVSVLPDVECRMVAAPDLLIQMLDKLIDNAIDFTTADGQIDISLQPLDRGYRLCVGNDGPALPERMQGQLFDSMVSVRTAGGDTPHMGFGLFIVRLIVEAHGGRIVARNRADDAGVEFRIDLPASPPLRRDSA